MKRKLEIMAPAGSFASLTAAINAGADSVYFGVEQLNMRARSANNFTIDDLATIKTQCADHKVKTYLTLNTILYDHDMKLMETICDKAKESGISAIIASDIAAILYANSIGLEVHISTQLNVTNIREVEFFAKYADTIVLARELTLKQIRHIYDLIIEKNILGPKGELVNIELFAHGALCVAISGKCYMSLATDNASANRGACKQNCRKSYRVIDEETNKELVIDNKYIMSPKDLCTIGIIDKIIESGVTVFKLEGRGRSPDYVDTVTRVYKEAILAYDEGTYTQEKIHEWTNKLNGVYNRGFWHGGYYLGTEIGEWSGHHGSKSTKEKYHCGKVTNFFKKTSIGEFLLEASDVNIGDELMIIGDSTGVVTFKATEIYKDDQSVKTGTKGSVVTIKTPAPIHKNDILFIVKDR